MSRWSLLTASNPTRWTPSRMPGLIRPGLLVVVAVGGAGLLAGCAESKPETAAPPDATLNTANTAKSCAGDAGIAVPAGFCASIFADNLGHARQLAVAPNGDVYVNTWSSMYTKMTNAAGGYIVALRDADRDGRAETIQRFGPVHQEGKPGGGTGIAIHGGALYVEADNKIVRYALGSDGMAPKAEPETIVTGLPQEGDHPMHPFAIASDGMMYVSSGSASNACQEKNRTLQSPGQKPCRELATRAGIWRYDTKKTGQAFSPRERYATGLRNAEALAVDQRDALYAAVHGRDQLSDNWPKIHTVEQQTELPAEIFARISEGADFGWPTCYYDGMQAKQVLAPEYGGDGGKAVGDCAQKARPDVAFPAHWAPDGLAFYSGTAFPQKYQGGAFVSFHGSWNRQPKQAGYLVAFVPFADGKPAGRYEEFATGFAGQELPADPSQAAYRPMGVAAGPDGAIYVSDDVKGRVWRIRHLGP